MTRVKICGITSGADLEAAVAAGADAVGFIVDVSVGTEREIDPERAAELVGATPPFVTSVLVTMPGSPEAGAELADRVGPDVVQVHGDATPEDVVSLSAATHGGVIRAVSPEDAGAYESAADALLVDSLDGTGAGGTGETHDWERTRDLVETLSVPVVLAGGLTPENVGRAVETVDPFGVDVASGVEAEPGRKDAAAVASFVERAGGAP